MKKRLAVKMWHLKSNSMVVAVEGISIAHEIDNNNIASILWKFDDHKSATHLVSTERGPGGLFELLSELTDLGYILPPDFGKLVKYPQVTSIPVTFGPQSLQPNKDNPTVISVHNKCITVSKINKPNITFYTGRSHKNYHRAMCNALLLANIL